MRSCGDWLEGGQHPAKGGCVCPDTGAANQGTLRPRPSTHAHGHLLMTIDIDGPSVQGAAGSEAELQLGSFCHSQHAFDAHAVWLLWTDLHRICNLLAPRAPSVQGRASPYMCHAQVAVLSKPFSHAFLRGLKTYCLLSMRTRLFKRKVTKSL